VIRFVFLCVIAAASLLGAQPQSAQGVWIDVPFVHQPREGCGAASLSMVMQYWAQQQGRAAGADSEVGAIQHELYAPSEHGILASSMEKYLRAHGFEVFALSGRWSDLETQLGKGRPLIVALRPAGQRELHYVVVDGVDAERGLVMMNDPAERKLLSQERAGFEKDWKATGNWMLLAVPAASSGH
jgi:ABC-type bacteriocin/lantibiotic exporter with double-glycine peptidase domain